LQGSIICSRAISLTDDEGYNAAVGGSTEVVAEMHCNARGMGFVGDIVAALPSGAYYVHGLFQVGGQNFTRAATQTFVV